MDNSKGADFIFSQKKIAGMTILEIPEFTATGLVAHGFSTRLGGCSQGDFSSLNLGSNTDDSLASVQANRLQFAQAVGIRPERVVCCHQVHGTVVHPTTSADCGKGFAQVETALSGVDGLMTNEPGVALMACFADCTPLFFLDPVAKAIAISHAGWKGTVGGIGVKTVAQMVEHYGARREDILVGIGPSIGPCHYEVDRPLIEKFQQAFDFWPDILQFTDADHAQLNLWEANRRQLMAYGVPAVHIQVSGFCTFCHQDLFFSHRGAHGHTGRMAGLIMLGK